MTHELKDAQMDEFLAGLKEARKEREAEWEEVKKRYPINPNDPPEKQKEMHLKQQVAMLDP